MLLWCLEQNKWLDGIWAFKVFDFIFTQYHYKYVSRSYTLHHKQWFSSHWRKVCIIKNQLWGLKGLGLHVRNTNCCYTVTKSECLKSRYRSQVLNTYDNIKHWSLLTYWFLLWFQTIMCTPPWKLRWTDNKYSGFTPVQEPRLATLAIPHLPMWALLRSRLICSACDQLQLPRTHCWNPDLCGSRHSSVGYKYLSWEAKGPE